MNDGDLEFGVGVDTSEAGQQLNDLRARLQNITADIKQMTSTAQNYVNVFQKQLMDAQKSGAFHGDASEFKRRSDLLKAKALGTFGKGNDFQTNNGRADVATTDAAVRAYIAQLNNSMEQASARIAEAHLKATQRAIQTSESSLVARARRTQRNTETMLRRENPTYQAAADRRERQNESDLLRSDQIGRDSFAMERTLERLGSNGGADLMAIQMRVLVGYQALSTAFNTLKNMSRFVVELDKQFRQFQAITATTNAEMVGIRDRLIEVSEATKFTALEVAQAATVMGQAGLSARQVGESIEAVTLLATAAGTELSTAVDLVTSTLSIFNLQASQTSDIANTMTSAINGSKLSIDKLVLGFQYAGNVAAQLGVTYQELTGLLGALANSGIRSGSTLGTGVRQLLIDMQTPTKKFREQLEKVGLAEADIDVKSRGLVTVLKTLKESGFGASEAFNSFEVRAAAAFTALSNNIDVAVELQKQFILSSAAVEANDIQMESLANTFAKFQSVLGTITYNVFRPFLGMLQDVTNGLADLLSGLNKIPGALEAASVIFVGIGSAVTLSAFGALFRAIGKGLPVVSTLMGLLTGAPAILTATGVAAGAAVGPVRALMLALKAHPVIAIGTALMTAGTAFYAFAKGGDAARDTVDALQGSVDAIQGRIDSTKDEMEALDTVITGLIMRKEELDKDPLLREAKILEIIQQFKELGGVIDADTSSVEKLIDALREMKEIDLSQQIEALAQSIRQNELLKAQIGINNSEKQTNLYDETSRSLMRAFSDGGYLPGTRTPATLNNTPPAMMGMFSDSKEIMEGIRIAYNREEVPTEGFKFQATVQGVANELLNRQNEFSELSLVKQGRNLTSVEKDHMQELKHQIKVLKALEGVLRPLLVNVFKQNEIDSLIKTQEIDRRRSEAYQAAAPLRESATDLIVSQTAQYKGALRKIQDPKTTASEGEALGKELQEGFQGAYKQLVSYGERVKQGLISEGIKEEDAEHAIKRILDSQGLNKIKNNIKAVAKDAFTEGAKIREEMAKQRGRTLDRQIQSQLGQLSNTYSQKEADQIEKIIIGLFSEKQELQDEVFADDIKSADGKGDEAVIRARKSEADAQLKIQLKGYIQRISNRRSRIDEIILDETGGALADETKGLEIKLRELAKKIAKTSPGKALDDLIQTYNTFADDLEKLQSLQQVNRVDSALLSKGYNLGSVGGDAASAVKTFMGMGYSLAQASGIVGNLMVESKLNPVATGDAGKAFGVAQWHPDRQARLQKFATAKGLDFNARMTQYRFVDYELKNYEKKAYASLMASQTPREASLAFMKDYERPGTNPETGRRYGYNRRVGYALSLAQGGFASDQSTHDKIREAGVNAKSSSIVSNEKLVARQITRNNDAQIRGLLANAKLINDPQAVLNLAKSVKSLYDGIIEAKVKSFETENAEALAAGNGEAQLRLDEMREQLGAERARKLIRLIEEYDRASEETLEKPLEEARLRLQQAKRPENVNNYTASELQDLEDTVHTREQALIAAEVAQAEEKLKIIREQLAEATKSTGENSAEAIRWRELEAQAERDLTEAIRERTLTQEVASKQVPSYVESLNSAIAQFKRNSKFSDVNGDMLSGAKIMENTFGGVLTNLNSGFASLFYNIGMGTQSMGDSFRQFGLSVIQMFMKLISEAMAYNLTLMIVKKTQDAMGASGGGGGLWGILGKLFIPGSMNGELIRDGIPGRDSTLRKVEPGEMILRRSAVSSIGKSNVVALNNLGNRSQKNTPGVMAMMAQSSEKDVVNVYVVSPDQVPQLGPKDVLATVADHLERRGPLRKLVKSIAVGG